METKPSPFTEKRRKQLYLKVAKKIAKNSKDYGLFACCLLDDITGFDLRTSRKQRYPELFLFKNDDNFSGAFLSNVYDDEGKAYDKHIELYNDFKVIVLLLCAEMCE